MRPCRRDWHRIGIGEQNIGRPSQDFEQLDTDTLKDKSAVYGGVLHPLTGGNRLWKLRFWRSQRS
jgi:hypothetical protein